MTVETATPSQVLMRTELSTRIREALDLRDWVQLEHWAKQWIQIEPKQPTGFKWLARASLAQQNLSRAAYGYGRLLDFEPQNTEARNFFAQYPSILTPQVKVPSQSIKSPGKVAKTTAKTQGDLLNPDERQHLAELEFNVAEGYFKCRLYAEAAAAYRKSFEWRPSQVAALGVARGLHLSQHGFEATKFLRDQLYTYPDWNEGRLFLGRVLYELGHRAEAQREWQLVLEQEPKNEQALSFMRLLMTSAR